jgi:hypothetical protein
MPNLHDPTQECGNCRFFVAGESPADPAPGDCRRFPPQSVQVGVGKTEYRESMFPTVSADLWCGEYQRIPQEAKK